MDINSASPEVRKLYTDVMISQITELVTGMVRFKKCSTEITHHGRYIYVKIIYTKNKRKDIYKIRINKSNNENVIISVNQGKWKDLDTFLKEMK
jgi:hypothetical protein